MGSRDLQQSGRDEAVAWHCVPCEVRWYGTDPKCWVCGEQGDAGSPPNAVVPPMRPA